MRVAANGEGLGRPRRWRIRIRLGLIAVTCVLPLWVATAIQSYNAYQAGRTRLLDSTQEQARALTLAMDRELASIQAALSALATSPTFRNGDFETTHRQATELLLLFPESDIIVADRSNQQILNSFRPYGTPLPKRGPSDVVRRIFDDGQPVISNLFFGAVTKRPLISMDVPIRVDGKVRYDLAMTLPVERLQRIMGGLPKGWVGLIIDRDGTMVTRSSEERRVIGQPATAAIRKALESDEGLFADVTSDGIEVISAHSRSRISGWSTIVGVPIDQLDQRLAGWLWSAVIGAGVSSALALLLAAMVGRRMLGIEAKLGESEARFRSMADGSPVLMWLADGDGKRYWFNKAWQEKWGSTLEQDGGWGWIQRIVEEDRQPVLDGMARSFQDMGLWRCEYRILNAKDGLVYWILDTGTPRHDADGNLLGFMGSAFDVTIAKTTELELRRYGEIVEAAGDMLAFIDRDFRYQFVNPAYAAMFGTTPAAVKGEWVGHVTGAALFEQMAPLLDRALHGETQHQTVQRPFADGRRRTLQVEYRPFRIKAELEGIVVSLKDVTELSAAEQQLKIAAAAFETQEAIVIADERGKIIKVNRAAMRITGFVHEDLLGRTPHVLASFRYDKIFVDECLAVLHRDGSWQGELWSRRKSGPDFPIWLTVSAVMGEDGSFSHYVGSFQDITERKASDDQIRSLAFCDSLTGLPNRRLLLDRLHQALAACERHRLPGAVLFIDLDHFKTLNDTRGHAVGDLLLIEVAKRLELNVRQTDTVARMGGDEFVVLLERLGDTPETAFRQARKVIGKIHKALNKPFDLDGQFHLTSPSIGFTLFEDGRQSCDDVLKEADAAMYQAKSTGRNRWCLYRSEVEEVMPPAG